MASTTHAEGRTDRFLDNQKTLRRLNCTLVEALLHAGTPTYATTESELVEMLLQRGSLVGRTLDRFAPARQPENLMTEILPDLIVSWRSGRFHWFSTRYLKKAAVIRVQQLRKENPAHLPLDGASGIDPVDPRDTTDADPEAPNEEQAEQQTWRVFEQFRRGLPAEEQQLLDLACEVGRGQPGHRQGWQKTIAERMGRPPCWVTRHLDDLFTRLAAHLGRPDLRCRKPRRKAAR